jgi:hypothetical protein
VGLVQMVFNLHGSNQVHEANQFNLSYFLSEPILQT